MFPLFFPFLIISMLHEFFEMIGFCPEYDPSYFMNSVDQLANRVYALWPFPSGYAPAPLQGGRKRISPPVFP